MHWFSGEMPLRRSDPFVPEPARAAERTRVLLVNGEEATRRLVAQALVDGGLTVDEAADAHDAIDIVDYAPPDVVVYTLGWGAGLQELDRLETVMEEHGDPRPAVVLATPTWMRAERGITLRGPVRAHDVIRAVGRAVAERRR